MAKNGLSPIAIAPPGRKKSGPWFYLKLLGNLASPNPYIVTSHYTERFQAALRETLAREEYDCLICEWTPYAAFIREIKDVKKIIVAHNIETSIWRGYLANETNPLKKLYIRNQARKVERFEKECFGWADGATAVSVGDADKIRDLGVTYPVEVIDNGVDTGYFKPADGAIDRDMLVFTGSMDWRPNQDAAAYFAHEIFPLIKAKRPTAKACFVGRDPGRRVLELAKIDGITITGTVDDVRPYIAAAGAYIVPLRIGGGSRLKIIEAMAMRKAVVSTSIGAEGLKVRDGENILLRDDPRSFADAVIECLEDDRLSLLLATSGLDTVMKYYRWEELGRRLGAYLGRICGK